MIIKTWKQRFFALAAFFAVFVAGLVAGIVIMRSSDASGLHSARQAQDFTGTTRLESRTRPLPQDSDGSFAQVADAALPVVVEISVVEVVEQRSPRGMLEFFFGPQPDTPRQEFERPGIGSGVIVRRNDSAVYILTNNHVVGDADEIEIGLYDGRRYSAELVGGDERTDLALLQIDTPEEVPIATLGDSDELHVGDWVLAVGNPFGFHSTVTAGIVSATGRRAQQAGAGLPELPDFIQTDAAVNPGNSGGALVNMSGEVVGINTWIVGGQSGGSVGLGFAIPMSQAIGAIDQFIEEGRIVYGWLGVSIADASPDSLPELAEDLGVLDRDGSLIMSVYRGSPAAEDGIRPGDFVYEIDGAPVADTADFQRVVGAIRPGEQPTFSIVRNEAEQEVTVTLVERAAEDEIASAQDLWPGLTVLPLNEEIRGQVGIDSAVSGAVVAAVQRNSLAATAGVRPGDGTGDSGTVIRQVS
ncbi:MAG: PDZ domain-containing protein [Spirochaetaceae bacterium]|nr:MAG: PDZ domain-containing protein [Spirochaetaceae bacterium]